MSKHITISERIPTTRKLTALGWISIIFVIAKLMGHFPYSWWWVFAPIWGPAAIFFTSVAIMVLAGVLGMGSVVGFSVFNDYIKRKKRKKK